MSTNRPPRKGRKPAAAKVAKPETRGSRRTAPPEQPVTPPAAETPGEQPPAAADPASSTAGDSSAPKEVLTPEAILLLNWARSASREPGTLFHDSATRNLMAIWQLFDLGNESNTLPVSIKQIAGKLFSCAIDLVRLNPSAELHPSVVELLVKYHADAATWVRLLKVDPDEVSSLSFVPHRKRWEIIHMFLETEGYGQSEFFFGELQALLSPRNFYELTKEEFGNVAKLMVAICTKLRSKGYPKHADDLERAWSVWPVFELDTDGREIYLEAWGTDPSPGMAAVLRNIVRSLPPTSESLIRVASKSRSLQLAAACYEQFPPNEFPGAVLRHGALGGDRSEFLGAWAGLLQARTANAALVAPLRNLKNTMVRYAHHHEIASLIPEAFEALSVEELTELTGDCTVADWCTLLTRHSLPPELLVRLVLLVPRDQVFVIHEYLRSGTPPRMMMEALLARVLDQTVTEDPNARAAIFKRLQRTETR